jgi:hypothetical protein
MYVHSDTAGIRGYYPTLGFHSFYPKAGTGLLTITAGGFARRGTDIYFWIPNSHRLLRYESTAGTLINNWDFSAYNMANLSLSDNYLYALTNTVADVTVQQILQINRGSGAIVSSIDLSTINAQLIFAIDDTLVYILCGGSTATLYYWDGAVLTFIGATTGQGFSPFDGAGYFTNGALYYGSNGSAGYTPHIFKIALGCPPEGGPIIAGLSTTGSTVAAGANITVSWTNATLPDISHRIELRPAPLAGKLGFVGAALATENTDGTANGSLSFPIPGGTTPGSYVFQYIKPLPTAKYVCSSAPFTVT